MEESWVVVTMPELQEGKEAQTVCIVKTDKIAEVEKIVLGKKLGTQGTEYGIKVQLVPRSVIEEYYVSPYKPLYLDLETFRQGIENKEIDWHQVIEWQRWGAGIILETEKKIIVAESSRERISPLWEKLGYTIETSRH